MLFIQIRSTSTIYNNLYRWDKYYNIQLTLKMYEFQKKTIVQVLFMEDFVRKNPLPVICFKPTNLPLLVFLIGKSYFFLSSEGIILKHSYLLIFSLIFFGSLGWFSSIQFQLSWFKAHPYEKCKSLRLG